MLHLNFSNIAKEFYAESTELLDDMENSLISIRENGADKEKIDAIFRAAHTIKGVSGMYEIGYIVHFTHVAENLLDYVRNGELQMSYELGELLLASKDHIQNLVEFAVTFLNAEEPTDELKKVSDTLSNALCASMPNKISAYSRAPNEISNAVQKASDRRWRMNIVFGSNVMEQGFEPASFLAYLRKNSTLFNAVVNLSALPLLQELEPTLCYVGFDVFFTTKMSEAEILDVFEFVADDCKIELKEELILETVASLPSDAKEETPKTPSQAPQAIAAASQSSYTIRVDAEKIDHLINLIGEMVIANANVVQQSIDIKNNELIESVSIVSRMLEDVRESAMQIRMVQIGETFNKFKRIVMDISKKLDKEIELVIKGGETELDKTVIEKITDPLVHIIRNALDHGIEAPADRGSKNQKGAVILNAYHDAGTVVIEISDDGRGLDKELLYQKGVEKGLIEEGITLSEQEIFKLILQPGFSTASTITDLSGRGVGMDVVSKNIEALRGNIEIKSVKGEGTSFTIRLPLTLAIIDGFLVKVGETFYVAPLDMVVECIELDEIEKDEMRGNNYIDLRGAILPLLNIREFFGEKRVENTRTNILVTHYGGKRYGFIVDELFGEFQTVIKPLGRIFAALRGISGATILGSGKVALILDVPALIKVMLTTTPYGANNEIKPLSP